MTEISIKANGVIIGEIVKVFNIGLMEAGWKENGKAINDMEKLLLLVLMGEQKNKNM